ncbi:GRIP and coiled-coil domain-containing protein 2 isoform X2 [Episyrphus balteatus]|uniref:GRIP and coiled-coil domain-containing protein 2 isoform X2 n=1 Tax=Episyrphus balteatus TaxID=286459 RepID=UPI0024863EBF|nr:GRIP and coiled-coil domain-containing protein 2 isoform X2 [Episyrphus balteatus]XP_055847361.1 GRIP and coiled-coil domain-containing protein 2 isoform X2 [Episyrphus balteatus]XP_055847362.1 GRIP and coiled-coil domain-containing protein 2 isoform X2 [Episyrphus balteatus]
MMIQKVDAKKNTIESMSREELINKCKGLLGIAKQAKKAKDEFAEENQKLKENMTNFETQREADKKSLLTMKEMLEQFTQNKLELASEISELRGRNKSLIEEHTSVRKEKEMLAIENEALRRQVNRLTEDNESLLEDINRMDEQLNQVNVLGKEQKQHLDLLELEVEKLKEYEASSKKLAVEFQDLQQSHETLTESYNLIKNDSHALAAKCQNLKEINTEQRNKFQGLKDKFIEVHKKLKQLKECKRVLVESHHEYADSISRWQLEIMQASEQLCNHIQSLTKENTDLKNEIQTKDVDNSIALPQLPILIEYCEKALVEYRHQNELIDQLKMENEKLKENGLKTQSGDEVDHKEFRNEDFETLERLKIENSNLREEAANAKQAIEDKIKLIESEKQHLQEKLDKAEGRASEIETLEQLQIENSNLREEAANAKQAIEDKIKLIESEKQHLQEKLDKAEGSASEFETEINTLKAKVENLTMQISTITNEKEKLEEEKSTIHSMAERDMKHLKDENADLKDKTTKSDEKLKEMQSKIQKLEEELTNDTGESELERKINIIESYLPSLIDCCEKALLEHRAQSELLNTLNNKNIEENNEELVVKLTKELEHIKETNEKLKEKLSKTKTNNEDVGKKNLVKLKNDLVVNNHICEDLQTKLEKQERENTDLLNEMRELNEALKGRGDVISKQQAKHQEMIAEMKKTSNALSKIEADLQSKEKLIKDKETKISKLSEDNKSALQEVNRLQNASRENESRIKQLNEEITYMKAQLENHDAQSEALSTSTISRAEELARLREVDESFEEKYNKLRSLAVKMKKKSHEQSLSIVELEKQIAESNSKVTDLNEKISSLEGERDSLQKELKTCKNQIESLKAEVSKLKVSKKQSNVLNLEIEAFEKSLNETTAKLTAKSAEYDLMRETLQSKESAIEVLKKENKILEESKESEIVHAAELKKQIDKLQNQLKDVVHKKQEIAAKLDECLNDKQTLQSEVEELKENVLHLTKKQDAERILMIEEKENLLQRINSLEVELTASNNRITLAERSFQDLQNEFANYKVKAQSVLRQNQTKESSKERELEEELRLVKGEHKDLSDRLQTFVEKYQASEKAIEELHEDNRCLRNRNSELQSKITEIRQQSESIARENKKQLETYQETLKGHRLQIEALDSCHLQQIQELHAKYNREIADLKSMQQKDSENYKLKPYDKHDYSLLEREDAEGSEAETTQIPKYLPPRKRSSHDLIPLDELLSSPMVDSTYSVLERRKSLSPSIELQETKERLMKQESRVRHLTSLLAESEQDLARLTQLNEMLKEEVRRQERTVEREKHMHNSEYLKNVVLKFISLNNVDERTRLVPVLNTILKLSPSEMEMLQNIAKGKALDNNNRSWGSFLPSWNTS